MVVENPLRAHDTVPCIKCGKQYPRNWKWEQHCNACLALIEKPKVDKQDWWFGGKTDE